MIEFEQNVVTDLSAVSKVEEDPAVAGSDQLPWAFPFVGDAGSVASGQEQIAFGVLVDRAEDPHQA
ncbi:hypothetical protein AB0451_39280 [Streptomyces sp. NPDC052000]|uniref:hypothetical protein n=1 Tax=Streptomyces sp. NPDC052000 TaxID=3155676 RepID=UPI00344B9C6C